MTESKALRIALFHNANGGGQKRAIYHLCRGLAAKGHTIDVFVPKTANEHYLPLSSLGLEVNVFDVSPKPKTPNLPVYLLEVYAAFFQKLSYLKKHNRLHQEIAAVINAKKYDVVWVDKCFVASSPYIFRFLSAPTLYYCHEPSREVFEERVPDGNYASRKSFLQKIYRNSYLFCGDFERWYLKRQERLNARHASRIVTNSRFTSEFIKQAFQKEALVNYLGVNTEVFRPLGLKREHLVLSVGHLWEGKRHELTIQAIGQIPKSKRPKFMIITDANWSSSRVPSLESLAKSLDVDLEIKFNVSDTELAERYNRAGVVVYAAYREPFGLVAIEAMACGAPVVGARDGGLTESILDGETGTLVDPSAESFAHAIETLLSCSELRERMGKAGVQLIQDRWTWEMAVERFENHLREVASTANLEPVKNLAFKLEKI